MNAVAEASSSGAGPLEGWDALTAREAGVAEVADLAAAGRQKSAQLLHVLNFES